MDNQEDQWDLQVDNQVACLQVTSDQAVHRLSNSVQEVLPLKAAQVTCSATLSVSKDEQATLCIAERATKDSHSWTCQG